ncbi:tetratricopeptide repeat protein [Sulfuriflexus sp.]|uniref:nuclear transport factor 2 family protein n=1 Tax=Sulfuriflexus sp. TaxID=2015443 RepID=UPI0028CF7399|nr:tetratricopeptide repeat protein [Sulfuriflexus sp.]MDT8404118.1 tetratricopeptide repeat protein [Sulfuriflexus sp.]
MKRHYFLYLLLAVNGLAQADLNQAEALLKQGQAGEALALVEQELRSDADNLTARFLQARLLVQLERQAEAVAAYEALTRDHPQRPEPYNNLAVLYAAQGKHNKARDALLNAINTHPSYATAYENLGNIYTKMAISAYNKALELDKQQRPAPISLAAIGKIADGPSGPPPVTPLTPPPAHAVGKSTTSIEDEIKLIIDTVNGWSNAWAAQNVDGYLAYYAPEFHPHNGLSRKQWEAQRRQRLRAPRFIRISIREPEVKILGSTTAKLVFEQRYESDRYQDAGKKVLLMEKTNGQWQILREYNA